MFLPVADAEDLLDLPGIEHPVHSDHGDDVHQTDEQMDRREAALGHHQPREPEDCRGQQHEDAHYGAREA